MRSGTTAATSSVSPCLATSCESQRCNAACAGWSVEEELIIATIQKVESVPRAEAVRRMQRRKKTSRPIAAMPAPTTQRLCRNPLCTHGDDRGPGPLAHLRADARYCNATCKKAVQRSPKRQNRPSNRQCLCGSKRGQFASLRSRCGAGEHAS
jgi:hypothetical protein